MRLKLSSSTSQSVNLGDALTQNQSVQDYSSLPQVARLVPMFLSREARTCTPHVSGSVCPDRKILVKRFTPMDRWCSSYGSGGDIRNAPSHVYS